MDLNESSTLSKQRHLDEVASLEAKIRAKRIIVPTSVDEVKKRLRELGHPVTIFAENPFDRRERLKHVIALFNLDDENLNAIQDFMNRNESIEAFAVFSNTSADKSAKNVQIKSSSTKDQKAQAKEIFYTAASDATIAFRKKIADTSFASVKARLTRLKLVRESESEALLENNFIAGLYKNSSQSTLNASQNADERPLTCVRFSKCSNVLASTSFGSSIKLWDVSTLNCSGVLRGHEERLTSVAWSPSSPLTLASASADSTCVLWDCRDCGAATAAMSTDDDSNSDNNTQSGGTILHRLVGHKGVISDCEFHPTGALLGTASHDYTWRLWDLETATELLLQDGHINECSTICFHPDGSLVMTTDLAGVALLWDLRSGQQLHAFQGHIKKITCSAFNANGFQVATGSVDNTVRIWDLRKKKCSYILPGHGNCISDVRFSASGEVLITSSFDASVKVWGSRDYRLLNTLTGHSGKVMACDISAAENKFASAGFDRTIKLYE